jgi:hypothetical protein
MQMTRTKRVRDLRRGDYLLDERGGVHAVLAVWRVGKTWSIKSTPMSRDCVPLVNYGLSGLTRMALPAPSLCHGYAF